MIFTPITTNPGQPFSLAEAKAFLRVDKNDRTHDDMITQLSLSAAARVAAETGLVLVNSIYQAVQYGNPPDLILTGRLEIPLWPNASIAKIIGKSSQGNYIDLDSACSIREEYIPVLSLDRSKYNDSIQLSSLTQLEVYILAGFGSTYTNIPPPLRHAVLLITLESWRARMEDKGDDLGADIDRALKPWRRLHL